MIPFPSVIHAGRIPARKRQHQVRSSGRGVHLLLVVRLLPLVVRLLKVRLLPLVERLRLASKEDVRLYYGLRFLKKHELEWIVSQETLKNQIALSLKDRCAHFS